MASAFIIGIVLIVIIVIVVSLKVLFPQSSLSSNVMFFSSDSTTNSQNMPPAIFINMDDAAARRASLEPYLQSLFQQVFRIPGVKAANGHEGCRLAHIQALGFGIELGVPYFLIFEDDVQALVSDEECCQIIHEAMSLNVDLALLEIGQSLEQIVQLEPIGVQNFRRILGGGNNAGCYLVKHDFARVLQQFWINTPNEMIDQSWQTLWPNHLVVLSKPQLYHQKEGFSLTLNDIRPETQPFD